jgi:Txe/YoeB family toxin of toxin-antitoxin system
MVKWRVFYTKRAQNDALKLRKCGLQKKVLKLINIVSENPYKNPPPFEKLIGLENIYSRRINIRHRFVYEIDKEKEIVIIKMMYKHYGE